MTKALSQLCCIGMSHKSASLQLREKVYAPKEHIHHLLIHAAKAFGFSECVVLSTCNRFDIYGVFAEDVCTEDLLLNKKLQTTYLFLHDNLSALASEFQDHVYCHFGVKAIEYILAVAASLDSLIIGETQITSQFKSALALATEHQTLGPLLHRLGQEALSLAKKVRTNTRISQKTLSMSQAAIDLAKHLFGDLHKKSFAIIGAGEMARLAATYARSYDPNRLIVFNRHLETAQELIHNLGVGTARSFTALEEELHHTDLVITATASPTYLLDQPLLQRVMHHRKNRPLFIADIAMPRNVHPACSELAEVYLFDMDDLKKITDQNLRERQLSLVDAQSFLKDKVQDYCQWLKSREQLGSVKEFRGYLQGLMEREAQKTLQKNLFKDLNDKQKQAIEYMLNSIADKVTADIIKGEFTGSRFFPSHPVGPSMRPLLRQLPPPPLKNITLATRGSLLAVWQAKYVKEFLSPYGLDCHLHIIKTTGDRIQDRFLHEIGGKGLFIKELEEALLAEEAHLAVHSLKDLPATVAAPFSLSCFLPRHPAGDLLLFLLSAEKSLPLTLQGKKIWGREEVALLPSLIIGTGSLRRKSLLLSENPNLNVVPIRGNVDTRISKLKTGELDAIVLSEAALYRLGLGDDLLQVRLEPHWFVPSAAQGALVIETLAGTTLSQWLRGLTDPRTETLVALERRVLALLGGDCTLPVGVHAYHEQDGTRCEAVVLSGDGRKSVRSSLTFSLQIGEEAAAKMLVDDLLAKGAGPLL